MPQAFFELPFWRAFLSHPLEVASPVPSGPALARAIAEQVPRSAGAVLELGSGTGAVTAALLAHAIAPGDLIAVERDPGLCHRLMQRFAGVNILHGDAFAFSQLISGRRFRAIISGLPVLGLKGAERCAFLAQAFEALEADGVFVQYSYSPVPPLPAGARIKITRRIVWKNLPPMHVWRYQRISDSGIAAKQ